MIKYKSIISITLLQAVQWLSHGNCMHKVWMSVGSVPACTETYRRLQAIWLGVRSASSPSIPIAYSLYHGPSYLMLGELGTSVLVGFACFFSSNFAHILFKHNNIKTTKLGHI